MRKNIMYNRLLDFACKAKSSDPNLSISDGRFDYRGGSDVEFVKWDKKTQSLISLKGKIFLNESSGSVSSILFDNGTIFEIPDIAVSDSFIERNIECMMDAKILELNTLMIEAQHSNDGVFVNPKDFFGKSFIDREIETLAMMLVSKAGFSGAKITSDGIVAYA